jgi:hypothetical protein
MKAAIIIDSWKLPMFKRNLDKAGYAFTQADGLTPDTLILSVETTNINGLNDLVIKAQKECKQ